MNFLKKLTFFTLPIVFIMLIIISAMATAAEKDLIEQSLDYLEQLEYNLAIDTLEQAALALCEKAHLELRNIHFIENEASGFGFYQAKESNIFAQGETFLIYAEPKNYTIKKVQQGLFEIHFKQDIYILDMEDNILWGQKDYLDFHVLSHQPNNEIFISNTISQDSPFPKGEYKFLLVVKDVLSQKTVEEYINFIVN